MSELVEVFRNEHYSRGIKLFDNGLYTEAIMEFEYVLDKDSRSPEGRLATFYMGEAYANLGKAHLRMNMLGRAEEELSYALELHPEFADLHLSLAVVRYRQGKYAEAEDRIREALLINPGYAKALMYLGLTLLRQGNENGLADIAGAVANESAYDDARYESAITLYRHGDVDSALRLFEDVAETDLDQIGFLLEKGAEMIESRMYTEALEFFQQAVIVCPHYADVRHNLALCYANLDRLPEAIEEFNNSLEINPSFVKARINLAFAYEKIRKLDLAISELEQVLRLDPQNVIAGTKLEKLRKRH